MATKARSTFLMTAKKPRVPSVCWEFHIDFVSDRRRTQCSALGCDYREYSSYNFPTEFSQKNGEMPSVKYFADS